MNEREKTATETFYFLFLYFFSGFGLNGFIDTMPTAIPTTIARTPLPPF